VMYAHTHKQPPNICAANPQLPASVDDVLQRALAKHPDDRYPSVSAFSHALRDALADGEDTNAPSPDQPATIAPPLAKTAQKPLRFHAEKASRVRHIQSLSRQGADATPMAAQQAARAIPHPRMLAGKRGRIQTDRGTRRWNWKSVAFNAVAILLLLGAGSLVLYWAIPHRNAPSIMFFSNSQNGSSTANGSPATTVTKQPAPNVPGTTWHIETNPAAAQNGTPSTLFGIAWSGKRFVAVGTNGTILTSPDGVSWTAQKSGSSNDFYGIAWSGSRFVIVGTNGVVLTSPDGIYWTPQTSNTQKFIQNVTWVGDQFVAVGDVGTILTSPDGATWTARPSGTSQSLQGATWSGSRYVAVGTGGTILTSTNGRVWTAQTIGSSQDLHSVVWSGSRFVAVGKAGTILTSPDGNTWSAQPANTTQYLDGVARWSGSQLIVVGGDGTILTSPDGAAWTQQQANTAQILFGIAWSGTRLVAVGQFGIILSSP
jgi:hypothetical protein